MRQCKLWLLLSEYEHIPEGNKLSFLRRRIPGKLWPVDGRTFLTRLFFLIDFSSLDILPVWDQTEQEGNALGLPTHQLSRTRANKLLVAKMPLNYYGNHKVSSADVARMCPVLIVATCVTFLQVKGAWITESSLHLFSQSLQFLNHLFQKINRYFLTHFLHIIYKFPVSTALLLLKKYTEEKKTQNPFKKTKDKISVLTVWDITQLYPPHTHTRSCTMTYLIRL